MSFVAINAITVPPGGGDELARRFAARAGKVDQQDGFEEFQLLRPADDKGTWLVYTRWRDEESFQAWMESRAFVHGHTQHGSGGGPPQGGPVATGSQLWSYRVEQRELSGN